MYFLLSIPNISMANFSIHSTPSSPDRVGSDASTPPASPGLERAVSQEAPEETKKDQKKRRASLANLSKDNLNKITIFQRKHKKVKHYWKLFFFPENFTSIQLIKAYEGTQAC